MTDANPKYKRQTFCVPTWALGYIYNADADDLTAVAVAFIDNFQRANNIVIFGEYGEEYFAHSNDVLQLGGTVVDIECLTLPT